jgi:peptide/nickel transport system permease protein
MSSSVTIAPARRAIPVDQSSTLRRWLRTVVDNRLTGAGTLVVLLMVLLAALGPLLVPYDSEQVDPTRRVAAPSAAHWLGTDQFGRDVLARVTSGARISLLIGFAGTALAILVGVSLGAVAAYVGGWIEEAVMRVMDIIMAFPYIVLAIALAWVVGPSVPTLIIVVGVIRLPQFSRITRATVLTIRERDFVLAARALGQRPTTLLLRHILPNAISPIVVYATLTMGTAINTEAALSFLGVGVQPPMASWGTMLSDGRRFLFDGPWIATFPGLAISIAILGFNLLGDGLRDAMDPTLRRQGGQS